MQALPTGHHNQLRLICTDAGGIGIAGGPRDNPTRSSRIVKRAGSECCCAKLATIAAQEPVQPEVNFVVFVGIDSADRKHV
jgi:hypothetical protein